MPRRSTTLAAALFVMAGAIAFGARSLAGERGDDPVANEWVYDDIEAGYAKAAESGKPLLVAFR